jgi:2-polyprenyl-3-methyl-5-hydroxy-6-metoxy-1,4-benzoquinol methylase
MHDASVGRDGWKNRLYEEYVSSEQASFRPNDTGWSLSDFPQIETLIRRHVPPERDARILDLGCGHGTVLQCLGALGYRRADGVDVSPEQVELAHRLGRSNVHQGDILQFASRFRAELDVVLLIDVLEHVDKQGTLALLDVIREALRPGGKLVIHVPNAEGIFGMRVRYGDFTHETAYTAQSITQVLRVCRFERIEAFEERPIVHGFLSGVRHWLWRLLTLRERLLLLAETGSSRGILSQNMIVVAHRQSR